MKNFNRSKKISLSSEKFRCLLKNFDVFLFLPLIFLINCSFGCGSIPNVDDLNDGGILDQYPAPPYGTQIGNTIANLQFKQCICSDKGNTTNPIKLERYLNKNLMLSIFGGACPYCEMQAGYMEETFYEPYKDYNFEVLLILFEDEYYNTSEEKVLDFCCRYIHNYGLTFPVAIDLDAAQVGNFINGVPHNMFINGHMVIRDIVPGWGLQEIINSIERLLGI